MSSLIVSPVFGAAVTVGVYACALALYRRCPSPLTNPAMLSIATIILLLLVTGISYQDYNRGGSVISFFLGPAVVALAVPLYRQRDEIRQSLRPLAVGLLVGALTGLTSVVLIARALGGSVSTMRSLAPKSVTSPIAIAIAEKLGGIPPLTAGVVVFTGVLGAATGLGFLSLIRVTSPFARGLAMGTAAHGLGTARAFEESDLVGAISGLAIGIHGLVAAVLLPLLLPLLLP